MKFILIPESKYTIIFYHWGTSPNTDNEQNFKTFNRCSVYLATWFWAFFDAHAASGLSMAQVLSVVEGAHAAGLDYQQTLDDLTPECTSVFARGISEGS